MNDSDSKQNVPRATNPPDRARLELESNVVLLTHQVAYYGRQMFAEGLEREKLSMAHWMILEDLLEQPRTMRELAQSISMPPSSLTGLVDNLVEQSNVERISDPEDRRIVRVRLTESGRQYVAKIRNHLMQQYQRAMSDLEESDLRLLERMYQTMLGRMLEYKKHRSEGVDTQRSIL
ncbi:MAG: MarR family winged helix-turn-helix transcriptional regulator [Deinococcales bacterium]